MYFRRTIYLHHFRRNVATLGSHNFYNILSAPGAYLMTTLGEVNEPVRFISEQSVRAGTVRHVVGRLGSAPFRFRCSGRLAFSLSAGEPRFPVFRWDTRSAERRHVSDPWIHGSSFLYLSLSLVSHLSSVGSIDPQIRFRSDFRF